MLESKIVRADIPLNGLELKFKISPSGVISAEKLFKLILKIEIKDINNNFEVNVNVVGNFEFLNVVKTENLENYFYVNAPAIIYPYVRSYIAALTALSGFETINLPAINIGNLKDELKANTVTE